MRESQGEGEGEKNQMCLRLDEGGSVWQKCSRHDLPGRRFICGGVCAFCLHERLSSLCSDCAHDLPCSCTPRTSVSDVPSTGIGSVGRVSNLIKCEPAFRKSKSMVVTFKWSAKPETNLQQGRGSWLRRLFRGETKPKAATITGESLKGNGWYFPSPIKVFRQSRASKMMFQQTSPLYRG